MTERCPECGFAWTEVPDWPGVFALGDCASIPDPRTGKPYPPTAQHALREASTAARNVAASFGIGEPAPFIFDTIGQLAVLGHRTAVAELRGWRFSGFLAFWMWRTVYWLKLPRLERQIRVAVDWTLDLLFPPDTVQLGSGQVPVEVDVTNRRTWGLSTQTDTDVISSSDLRCTVEASSTQSSTARQQVSWRTS